LVNLQGTYIAAWEFESYWQKSAGLGNHYWVRCIVCISAGRNVPLNMIALQVNRGYRLD
jgi:hypothetical protein